MIGENELTRGKNSVLFNYLPEKTVDYRKGIIVKITKWWSAPIEEVNKARIIKEVKERSKLFDGSVGFPENPSLYEALTPRKIDAELYPRTFICARCKATYSFKRLEDFGTYFQYNSGCKRKLANEKKCNGNLRQFDMIHFHKSGEIDFPTTDRCPTHGYEYIILDRRGSNAPSEWAWKCGICSQPLHSLFLKLGGESGISPKPFRSITAYIPHSFTLVNIPSEDDTKVQEDVFFQKFIIAKHLEVIEPRLSYQDFFKQKKNNVDPSYIKGFREKLLATGMNEKEVKQILGNLNASIDETDNQFNENVNKVSSFLTPNTNLSSTAFTLMEFNQLKYSSQALSIKDIMKKAETDNNHNPKLPFFESKLKEIGIKESYVLNNITIIKAVYGYTRGTLTASEAILHAFPPDGMVPGKTPIYSNKLETEGILLELDRDRILGWLNQNGVNVDYKNMTEAEKKAWLINNINPASINPFVHIDSKSKVTQLVYGLLHTISHALILKASAQCGLDKDSLGELIYPQVPAIVIYNSGSSSDFQLGGMYTLFENSIIPWIDETERKVKECINDPICFKMKGSCFACLHLSEHSCVHFNCDLDRRYLIGDKSNNIKSFWEQI